MKIRLFALFFAALILAPFANAAVSKNIEILFCDPKGGLFGTNQDATLDNALVDRLRRAVKGSTFRASFYQVDDAKIADEVIAASKRGVDVKIVLDDTIVRDSAYKAFRTRIMGGLKASQYHVCAAGACIGSKNNHNKFYVFSEIQAAGGRGTIRNVVMSSSANITDSQKKKHNNTVIVNEDPALHALFFKHTDNLFNDRKNPDYLNSADGHGNGNGASKVTVLFYPGQGPKEPMLEELKSATCEGGGEVLLVHSLFQEQYALDVMKELQRLKKSGCTIGMVLRESSDDNEWVGELNRSGLPVTYKKGVGIHSKYLLLNAMVANADGTKTRRKAVYTGSANMQSKSMFENDETVLRIEENAIYDIYRANWMKIQKQK